MRLELRPDAELWDFLSASESIDIEHPVVLAKAAALPGEDIAYARAAFEFVRDEIRHSTDAGDRRVTWRASDAIEHRTGICHAKAHALVALLRAGGVPAGLCYQRLDDDNGGHVVHGLAAVWLHDRWVRLDPRGGKPGGHVEFSATEDRLVFPADPRLGEVDYPVVHVHPHPLVLAALRGAVDRLTLSESGGLPDELPDLPPDEPPVLPPDEPTS